MSSIFDWSTTAASNANSDDQIDWSEGMSPSEVNDSSRFMMQRIAEFLVDIGGAITATGTANNILVTTESAFTTYANGRILAFRAIDTNTTPTTLSVNSIGTKPLRKMTRTGETVLTGGEIQNAGIYVVQYQAAMASGTGAWLLLNPTAEGLTTALSALSTKTILVDSDSVAIVDSQDSNTGKRITWALLKESLTSAFASVGRIISAGNGLTGGGSLAANRTISMGTPGTLTYETGNGFLGESHFHEVNYVMPDAGVVGSYAYCRCNIAPVNPGDVVSGANLQWGGQLGDLPGNLGTGQYMCMGYVISSGSRTLFHRIS